MKGGPPFLCVYVFGPAHEFPLRTLLLPFPFCFLPAASLSIAKGGFFACVEVTEQYYGYMRTGKTTLLLGKEKSETVKKQYLAVGTLRMASDSSQRMLT